MRRNYKIILVIAVVLICAVGIVLAGNPHFIWVKVKQSNNTVTVSGKEAGLGNEERVFIHAEATVACINRGGHNPKADNKTEVSAYGYFPVQNGKAYFELRLIPMFQPKCSPPMRVEFSNILVRDETNELTY